LEKKKNLKLVENKSIPKTIEATVFESQMIEM